jgi:hypothetical protein
MPRNPLKNVPISPAIMTAPAMEIRTSHRTLGLPASDRKNVLHSSKTHMSAIPASGNPIEKIMIPIAPYS